MTPQNLPALLGPIYLVAVAWPLTRIDLRERRLPNRLVLPALAITLFGQLLAVLCSAPAPQLLVALACASCAFIGGLLLNRFAGLGMGDVKLITAITLALAWFNPFVPLVALGLVLLRPRFRFW
jgi:leader peptidase (prepilin peptidase)/N-methyltransferase